MATRKSTRGKTKTANKSVRSSSRVQTASRAKATTKTEVTAARTSSSKVSLLDLRRILMVGTALYVVLAIAAGALMDKTTAQITTGYLAKDELLSRTSTVFAPAIHVLYDLEIRWALVAILIICLILPVLYLTRMERAYANRLRGRVLPWRWIDIGVTSALMLELVALLSGVQDVMALKAVAGLVVLSAVLGWLSERENENATAPVWGAYVASLASGTLAWLIVGVSLIGTTFYGLIRAPWYVYALFGTVGVGCLLMAVNLSRQHRRLGRLKDYKVVERNYLALSTLTKVAFAVILIIGLRSR